MAESGEAVAEVFLSRALELIEACPTSEPITQSYVVAGEVSWDSCCGVLVGAVDRVFRYVNFPNPVSDHTDCDVSFIGVDVILVLLRCVPTLDERGNLPTPGVMSEAFGRLYDDAAMVYNAVTGDLPPGWLRANVEQSFAGASGGCGAVLTTFTIGLPQSEWCLDCAEPEPEPEPEP